MSKTRCSRDGCQRPRYARGLCQSHYSSAWQRGALPPKQPRSNPGLAFARAALTSDTADCIIWPFAKVTNGYGTMRVNGASTTVHRYVCEQVHGPSTLFALHRCGNASCINPRHIRWGTPMENAIDRANHGMDRRGDECSQAVLSTDDVRKIKQRLAQPLKRGDKIAIAREYGVSKSTILDIDAGRAWRHVA